MKGKLRWWIIGLVVVLLGVVVWLAFFNGPKEQPKSIMVEGVIYDCTDQETEAPPEDQILGTVISAVERTQLPEQEGQSNFPECVGQSYAMVEGQVTVFYEGIWHRCIQAFG